MFYMLSVTYFNLSRNEGKTVMKFPNINGFIISTNQVAKDKGQIISS